MRRLALLAALAPLVALGADAAAPRPLDEAPLRALLDPARPDHLAGLQVAVVRDGVLQELAYGRRFIHPTDRARDLPLTAATRVRAASASKPVTAIAVMRLVAAGRLDLDADASRHLGFALRNPRHPDAPITLRMLLAHTGSVVDGAGYVLPIEARIADLFTPGSPSWADGASFSAHAPGTYFEYSNLGWGLLGTAIERATGERFDRFVAREVLARAGIGGGFDVAALDPDRLAVLYRKGSEDAPDWDPRGPWLAQTDDPRPVAEGGSGRWSAPSADPRIAAYLPGTNGALFSPQGGLRASAGEVAQLWSCLLRGKPVRPAPQAAPRAASASCELLDPRARAALLAPRWRFDPHAPNGDTLEGQFLSWGLGVQRFLGAHRPERGMRDSPSARLDGVALVGHLAEAYGLFGGALFAPDGRFGIVYFATGTATSFDANPGARSAFLRWEETLLDWAAREAWRP
jgi:CubicO group peptidase (beta-lactamase class C family)